MNRAMTGLLCVVACALLAVGCAQRKMAGAIETSTVVAKEEGAAAAKDLSEAVSPAPAANEIVVAGKEETPAAKPEPEAAAKEAEPKAEETTKVAEEGKGGLREIPEIKATREAALKEGKEAGAEAAEGATKTVEAELEKERTLDAFEGQLVWQAIAWDNANDCDIAVVEDKDGHALSLKCKAGEQEKAGATLNMGAGADVSRFKALLVDVKVEGENELEVALAFQTSAYFEAVRQNVKPGWNRNLTFPLVTADYKTDPEWKHNSTVNGLTGVKSVFFIVYYKGEAQVLIDNMRLVQEAP
jgi:hypothetical protein